MVSCVGPRSTVHLRIAVCRPLKCRSVTLTGSGKKCSNSISVGAFLDEDDDVSLEEIKNRQNTIPNQSQPTVSAFGNLEHSGLSQGQQADPAGASDPHHPHSSRNGICSPLTHSRIPGVERPEALSGEEALSSPVSSLTLEFDKMNLQNLGGSLSKTANKNMKTKDKILTSRKDTPPATAVGLGNDQMRADGKMSLDPSSPEQGNQQRCRPQSQPTPLAASSPSTRDCAGRLFLFG